MSPFPHPRQPAQHSQPTPRRTLLAATLQFPKKTTSVLPGPRPAAVTALLFLLFLSLTSEATAGDPGPCLFLLSPDTGLLLLLTQGLSELPFPSQRPCPFPKLLWETKPPGSYEPTKSTVLLLASVPDHGHRSSCRQTLSIGPCPRTHGQMPPSRNSRLHPHPHVSQAAPPYSPQCWLPTKPGPLPSALHSSVRSIPTRLPSWTRRRTKPAVTLPTLSPPHIQATGSPSVSPANRW